MARKPQDVTDAELGVLQVLWENGPLPIRRLTEALYPEGKTAHYATVQKLLDRLEAKGYIRRDRSASVHVFAAAVGRGELIGRRLKTIADKLCGEWAGPSNEAPNGVRPGLCCSAPLTRR